MFGSVCGEDQFLRLASTNNLRVNWSHSDRLVSNIIRVPNVVTNEPSNHNSQSLGMSSLPKLGRDAELLSFEAPSPFTALTFSADSILLAGGGECFACTSYITIRTSTLPPDDGSLRVFDLSPSAQRTLCKAIRGLPDEVSSICVSQVGRASSAILGRVWVASGKQVFLFNLDSDRMVINVDDAEDVIKLIVEGEGGEDNVLNEVRHLAECPLVLIPFEDRSVERLHRLFLRLRISWSR